MRKIRYLIFLAAAVTAAYILAIAVAYRWPPVLIRGLTQGADPSRPELHAELAVQAPVRLLDLRVSGGAAPGLARLAGQGAVAGQKLEAGSDTLQLSWEPGSPLPERITLRYRYLGWLFQTSQPITWQAKAQAALAPAPDSALGRLCLGEGLDRPEAALAEVSAAVSAAGGDMKALTEHLIRLAGERTEPMAVRADADGDGRPDTLVGFGACQTPLLVYLAASPGAPLQLPESNRYFGRPLGGTRIDQVADVNGDGRPELVLEQQVAGGSADNTYLYIYQYQGGNFVSLFHDHLSNWRGQNRWTVGNSTISIQCRPLGLFEHKHSPSRQQTEKFRWNPATAQYELTERTREPVESQIQQFADAEEIFQSGNYSDALIAYGQVARFKAGAEAPEIDWPALAAYRIGQIHALAGRRTEALAALDAAATGAAPVGNLAAVFRGAYTAGDAADGFVAAWGFIQKTQWSFLVSEPVLGARRAMQDAFVSAGRNFPADLPAPVEMQPPVCLSISH